MSVLCTLRSQWRGLCTVTCPCLCTRARSALSPKRFRYRDVPVFVIVFRDVSVSVYPRGTPCHEVDSSISLSLSLSPPLCLSLSRALSLALPLLSVVIFSLSSCFHSLAHARCTCVFFWLCCCLSGSVSVSISVSVSAPFPLWSPPPHPFTSAQCASRHVYVCVYM